VPDTGGATATVGLNVLHPAVSYGDEQLMEFEVNVTGSGPSTAAAARDVVRCGGVT
jgi:hypothetical protein